MASTASTPAPTPASPPPTRTPFSLVSGLLLCAAIAIVATWVGVRFPLLGAPVAGLLLGLVVGNVLTLPAHTEAGIQFSIKKLLKWAIIGLGLRLPLQQLWSVGRESLSITLITLSLAFVAAFLANRWLKLSRALSLLIGAGTAICGGSAIAAIAPIIEPKKQELALALTTIFLFNLVAVFLFPFIGHTLGLSDAAFGLWAGTAINDTSSVVAAAYSYSQDAGDIATIVKLTRASLILPVCLIISILYAREQSDRSNVSMIDIFPWFILGFVLAAVVHTLGILPVRVEYALLQVADFMLVMALVAVGLGSRLKQLMSAGVRPLMHGTIVWAVVAISALMIMKLQNFW